MVNEGEDQHGHVDPEVVNHVEDQPEHIDSEPNQTTGELFFKRHSGIIVLAVAALAFANFVIKDIFGDQAKEIADSVTAAEAVFIIRQDLGSINEKITGIANAARLLVANDAERERSSRKPSDEKTRGVGKGLPTLKRKNENDREAVTLVEFAMLDLGFQEQRRRISLVTLDNIAQLAKSFTDPKLEKQLSSVRAELEHYDRGYKDLRETLIKLSAFHNRSS